MDCPQCGAEVPADDEFCGKCGYARRDQGPERLDQSRIRIHEEPEPQPDRSPSQQRVRKHTVLGISPTAEKPIAKTPVSAPPPPPTPLSSGRPGRSRTPQKTMLGIPRPDFPDPPSGGSSAEPTEAQKSAPPASEIGAPPEPAPRSHRARARVRYDSANEPLPVTQRRTKALRGLAVLVVLAIAWLGYRFLTVHG
ncbi:MAG: zinc-ribbon domain-containing protein [Deltaproteobacteria bacterium]|nr:zinc-ribbon domain-containing protein [Deltaproteobacteria bacterium]